MKLKARLARFDHLAGCLAAIVVLASRFNLSCDFVGRSSRYRSLDAFAARRRGGNAAAAAAAIEQRGIFRA